MSYRKHLLGETSLERKCRFLSGLVILSLVTSSAYWTSHQYETLVNAQEIRIAGNPKPLATTDRHLATGQTRSEILKTRAKLITAALATAIAAMIASG